MKVRNQLQLVLINIVIVAANVLPLLAQTQTDGLEAKLKKLDTTVLAREVRFRGDPKRGALLFFSSAASCHKCHLSGDDASPLGPDLATLGNEVTDEFVITSILRPSSEIRKGFETVTITTMRGKLVTGLVVVDDQEEIVLRDAADYENEIVVKRDDIDETFASKKSLMPEGLVESLHDEHQFYDLASYVMEVTQGGPERAAELKPDPQDLIIPDDSKDLDHAGILRSLGQEDFEAGKKFFLGYCKNCHGVDGNTPTLPTARAFGTQKLKYGADPYDMFLTLTRGNGMMAPMMHLSPKERYQVVHYIREALMKPSNPEYVALNDTYLNRLPKGSGKGGFVMSADRDFGPVLASQLGDTVNNSLSFRLPDKVTVNYDLHRMRFGGVWQGGFLDLSETHHYRQRGEKMPQIDGTSIPGLDQWRWAFDGAFEIPVEAKPPRGPVRGDWLRYDGHYLFADQAVLSYAIHGRKILETIQANQASGLVTINHTLRVDAGHPTLRLSVAKLDKPLDAVGLVPRGKTVITSRSGPAGENIAVVTGVAPPPVAPHTVNAPLHLVTGAEARALDLGTPGRTVLVRFRTDRGGTLVASAPQTGDWKPNGKTLFIRGNHVVFDIGWVGAMQGTTVVTDNQWHTAALVIDETHTRLYVDGRLESERRAFRREPVDGHVFKIGATATNFGGDYQGEIAWVRIFNRAFSADDSGARVDRGDLFPTDAIFAWEPAGNSPDPDPELAPEVVTIIAAAAATGDTRGLTWEIDDDLRIVLTIPASTQPRVFRVLCGAAEGEDAIERFNKYVAFSAANEPVTDPSEMTHGGPVRWPQKLTVHGTCGEPINGYSLDTIPVPFENPWNAWLRTSSLDFFNDGRAVVTTHGGDVYVVSGIDQELENVTWSRFASGLFEPFGVRVVDGTIYVTCRDGIKRLHDYDGNGEADFIEAFWIDDDVSCMFHAFNFDLQTDSIGNFYLAKAGQYSHHHRPGAIMRIPPEGGRADVVAWGLRTPNGMGKLADDRITVSDNQGPWMPAGKVSLVQPGKFFGNMPSNQEQDKWLRARHGGQLPEMFEEPMIWTPQDLDNSCGGQVWAGDARWGPLSGRLIHSSFGKGWLYYMSLQEVGGTTQASIVALPHQWDAGVMRLCVNPADGQVYGTGLSGWQGPAGGKDGCLQRLRYAGSAARIIDNVRVTPGGLELNFNFALDPATACETAAWDCEMWNYFWSAKYGSDQFSVLEPQRQGHDKLMVKSVSLSKDQQQAQLEISGMAVCDQLSLKMTFKDTDGKEFSEHVYLTIHAIPKR